MEAEGEGGGEERGGVSLHETMVMLLHLKSLPSPFQEQILVALP